MTPSQRRMLENARDGRELGHGFPRGRYGLGRSASSVCASLYDLGLITHSLGLVSEGLHSGTDDCRMAFCSDRV